MNAIPPAFDLLLFGAYYGLLGVLALFGLHRAWLLAGWLRAGRRGEPEPPPLADDDLPGLCVQLPLYNEPAVAERLLRAAAAMDYPRGRFEVQVLDDSTDETPDLLAPVVAELRAAGLRVEHLRRPSREGFKAGALAWGLERTDAELLAVFDADFVPPADFARRAAAPFADPRVGMVQARWTHRNRRANLLTRLQAVFLDAHFLVEHPARAARGRFFNFNGTAGILRRAAIDDAGGWRGATLTEDLDLSLRMFLRGWRFRYLRGLEAPAEVPESLAAYRTQQQRWAKGSIETARLLLGPLWRSDKPLASKVDASAHLLANASHPMVALLAVLLGPVFFAREAAGLGVLRWADLAVLPFALFVFLALFAAAGRAGGRGWLAAVGQAPLALALGIGMSLNNGLAVLQGLAGRRTGFVRTPKTGDGGPRAGRPCHEGADRSAGVSAPWLLPTAELAAGASFVLLGASAVLYGVGPAAGFLGLFAAGYLLVGGLGAAQAAGGR